MKIILFFIAVVLVIPGFGQGNDPTFALTKGDQIEDLMIRYNELGEFNGSILIVEDGESIYENTLGFADFETREPLDGEMPFYLASLDKHFAGFVEPWLDIQKEIRRRFGIRCGSPKAILGWTGG